MQGIVSSAPHNTSQVLPIPLIIHGNATPIGAGQNLRWTAATLTSLGIGYGRGRKVGKSVHEIFDHWTQPHPESPRSI